MCFNSLFRDHKKAEIRRLKRGQILSFNSLFRDHARRRARRLDPDPARVSTPSFGITKCSCVLGTTDRGGGVSTPSFGITIRLRVQEYDEQLSFNSLFRDHVLKEGGTTYSFYTVPQFQLPLSGSRRRRPPPSRPTSGRSFNSLFRDHIMRVHLDLSTPVLFQLPLSGSHGLVDEFGWSVYHVSTPSFGITKRSESVEHAEGLFQLPLSGSPSPIPGFSGSPRLSATAPLRKNDS